MPIIVRSSAVIASPSGSTDTPLIGGLAGAPSNPSAVALTSGFTKVFTVDFNGNYFYAVDTSGNIVYWSALTSTTAPAIIVTAATLGATVIALQISVDGTHLFAATSAHTILTIPTTAPYTPAVLAGSGTAASTDGTGTGAAFRSIVAMAIDPLAGAFLIAFEGDTGNIRKVVIATGVVTTPNSGVGGASAYISLALDKSGYFYVTLSSEQVLWGLLGSGVGGNLTFSGTLTGPLCVSTSVPAARTLYLFCSAVAGGAVPVRVTLGPPGTPATGTTQLNLTSAAAAHPVNLGSENNGQMHFRYSGLYFVDSSGTLNKVYG